MACFDPVQAGLISDALRAHSEAPSSQLSSILSMLSSQRHQCDVESDRLYDELKKVQSERTRLCSLYEACSTLSAPIRRLPTEVLGEIFAWSATRHTNQDYATIHRYSSGYSDELTLLRIAQVCARWRTIITGTPALWTRLRVTTENLTSPFLRLAAQKKLELSLERSGDLPLDVVVQNRTSWLSTQELDTIVRHSLRWRSVAFLCRPFNVEYLTAMEGKLPLLESLTILAPDSEFDEEVAPQPITLFDAVPQLKSLVIDAQILTSFLTIPLERLNRLEILGVSSTCIALALTSASRLPIGAKFRLNFFLDDWTQNRSQTLRLTIPATVSLISHFTIEVEGEFHRHHCQQAFDSIVSSLTLPSLQHFTFASAKYERFPLVWPHSAILALCDRSAFHSHLRSLSLLDVHMTPTQLVQCLRALPALAHLAISDHKRIQGRGVNLEFITDELLAMLTLVSGQDTQLVPRLENITLRSRRAFTDSVLLDFIISRVQPGQVFKCALEVMPNFQGRNIGTSVRAKFREMQTRGELKLVLLGIE